MKTIHTKEHKRLVALLIAKRKARGLTQVQLARKMRTTQQWVSHFETGQRRISIIEFLALAKVIRFDVAAAIDEVREAQK